MTRSDIMMTGEMKRRIESESTRGNDKEGDGEMSEKHLESIYKRSGDGGCTKLY